MEGLTRSQRELEGVDPERREGRGGGRKVSRRPVPRERRHIRDRRTKGKGKVTSLKGPLETPDSPGVLRPKPLLRKGVSE